ncbi:g3301 [Coccomyxa elongata]
MKGNAGRSTGNHWVTLIWVFTLCLGTVYARSAGHRSLAQSRVAGALDTLKTDAAQKVSGVKDTVRGLTPASKAQLADVANGIGALEHRVDWLGQACLCRRAAPDSCPPESPPGPAGVGMPQTSGWRGTP